LLSRTALRSGLDLGRIEEPGDPVRTVRAIDLEPAHVERGRLLNAGPWPA
jgi:hypothetical protein